VALINFPFFLRHAHWSKGSTDVYTLLSEKAATPFKNSVVIGHWLKNAKVTAIKQQTSK
jgi:hypothetical protein